MNLKIYVTVISFLALFVVSQVKALVPIEGVIYGNIQDIYQTDPFEGNLSYRYTSEKDDKEFERLNLYYALYKQGTNLINKCEAEYSATYETPWLKELALRSIIGNLQFIGLDLSLKAITAYAKKLEIPREHYLKLAQNLVTDTCSKNLSVYSIKLLRDNFKSQWDKNNFELPNISKSPYFTDEVKRQHDNYETIKREFNYTIRNFRAFCSWNGDVQDYRMLSPYLKNPYLMSIVFNSIDQKKFAYDIKTKQHYLVADPNLPRVACEDLICRSRKSQAFTKLFPRMIGSTTIRKDLDALYCDVFQKAKYKRNKTIPKVKTWIEQQAVAENKVESLNFLSLVTEIPDMLVMSENYQDVVMKFRNDVQARWDLWAQRKIDHLDTNLFFEEPLELELVSQVNNENIRQGDFKILFDVGLSELDKVLAGVDKISAYFNLQFKRKYLAHLKEKYFYYQKIGNNKKLDALLSQFKAQLKSQIQRKERYFSSPIWNDKIYDVMATEVINQLKLYRGKKLGKLNNESIIVPVKFRFGVFALQYIRQKYKFERRKEKALTFKQ